MDTAILKFFESFRSPALDYVFGIISFFGEGIAVGGIVLLLWWLLGSRAEQLFFTALTSAPLNSMMKVGVHRPRPYAAGVVELRWVETPFFSTANLGDNLSFPSGHAQATTSALVAISLRAKGKKKIAAFLASILWILLVCCSRLYFGVHYPTDLLAGIVFGTIIAVFWHLIFIECYGARHFILMGIAAVCLLLAPFANNSDYIHMTALVAGGAFFLPLTSFLKYDAPKFRARSLLRLPVGLLCVGAVFAATYFLPSGYGYSLLKWFLLVGSGTFLATVFFKLLKI